MIKHIDGMCLCPGCGVETIMRFDGMIEEDAMCDRCYNQSKLRSMSEEELDELVDDFKMDEAVNIKNEGIDSMIDYLLESGWEA